MKFDLDRLGGWSDLPFFNDTLPDIQRRLADDANGFLPAAPLVFAALERTQPQDVKVVILGQDPYPQPGKAHGLAFSIPDDYPPRARRDSLDNILAEVSSDTGVSHHGTDLGAWADQGVLLLNAAALTVCPGRPNSHAGMGWNVMTTQILCRLSDQPRAYLLWGGNAHKIATKVDASRNFVLRTSHPSPLGAFKSGRDFVPFIGARPFSRVNAWLQANHQPAINWTTLPETT